MYPRFKVAGRAEDGSKGFVRGNFDGCHSGCCWARPSRLAGDPTQGGLESICMGFACCDFESILDPSQSPGSFCHIP